MALPYSIVPEEKVLNCEINARNVGNIAYIMLKDKYTFKIHEGRLKEGQDPSKKPLVLHYKNPQTNNWEVKKGLQPALFKDLGDIGKQVFGAARDRLLTQAAAEGDGSAPMPKDIIDTCERLNRINNKLQHTFFKYKVLHAFKSIVIAQQKASRMAAAPTYASVLATPPPPDPST